MTIQEALLQGYNVDKTCYPHMIYKGPRFKPTSVGFVLTELEEILLAACKRALAEFERHSPLICHGCTEAKAALLCAKESAK